MATWWADPWDEFMRNIGWEETPRRRREVREFQWAPPLDVNEHEQYFRVHLELPGVKSDNINISVHDNHLTIMGEKQVKDVAPGVKMLRNERQTGKFVRRLVLPTNVDAQNIEACLKNGVLHLTVPKIEPESRSRRIEIKESTQKPQRLDTHTQRQFLEQQQQPGMQGRPLEHQQQPGVQGLQGEKHAQYRQQPGEHPPGHVEQPLGHGAVPMRPSREPPLAPFSHQGVTRQQQGEVPSEGISETPRRIPIGRQEEISGQQFQSSTDETHQPLQPQEKSDYGSMLHTQGKMSTQEPLQHPEVRMGRGE
jgi:HSP20 family protein